MATGAQQKPCVECQNGMVICNGCENRFCHPHFDEHLQEIQKRMDQVVQEHDQLVDTLNSSATASELLSQINEWEQQSFEKIKDAARQARIHLQKSLDHKKDQLMVLLRYTAEQLESSQASKAYTEKDLNRWLQQLEELRKISERPIDMEIVKDNAIHASVSMIKVVRKLNAEMDPTSSQGPAQSTTLSAISTLDGTYRVTGYTENSSDGNQTTISDMILHLKNGQLSGSGRYNAGSKYNDQLEMRWTGSYDGKKIQWAEYYGNNNHLFNYDGYIDQNRMQGTYKWTCNDAVGLFDFQLERLND